MGWRLLVLVSMLWPISGAFAADSEKGKATYATHCTFCHGTEGRGDGPAGTGLKPPPSDFTSAQFWRSHSVDHMKDVITKGEAGTAMVPFGTALTPEEIDNLVEYLRTLAPK